MSEPQKEKFKLLAHITKINESRKEQLLKEHSLKTAQYASEHSIDDFKNIVYLAGILHDMGKATKLYNDYLEDAYSGKKVIRGSVNHTFAGVIWLLEKYHKSSNNKWERMTCEIICFAIGSHHGLFDCVDLDGKNGFKYRLEKDKDEICYEEAVENFFGQIVTEDEVNEYFKKSIEEIKLFWTKVKKIHFKKEFFQVSLLSRLILSAVIYGDRRDTREFMLQKNDETYEEKGIWERQQDYFENKMKKFNSTSELNQVRKCISEQCFDFAKRECGIYRLNVPTGGGKTLCSLRYVLEHAKRYKKKRIIFIIPLLSVLEQNVEVIRNYFQEKDYILEHHSNVINEMDNQEKLDRYELLITNWDTPVIVSTLVQLLSILFDDATSAIGRMQALCHSVIVIDEIQSIPKKMIDMFNLTMNFLKEFCNTTIILSSATQPCLESLECPIHLSNNPDMVKLTQAQLDVFKRAEIINKVDPYGMEIEDCAEFAENLMEDCRSLLIVVNTKSEAKSLLELLRNIQKENDKEWDIFHLSTNMCQQHRINTLNKLQEQLKILQQDIKEKRKPRKIICVATQLVEAGVDFSFENVIRILAGIDNLAQAAGRCNRNGEYPEGGKVYLVNLKNEKLAMLPDIAIAQNSTKKVIDADICDETESLIGENATQLFYTKVFKNTKTDMKLDDDGKSESVTNLLANVQYFQNNKANQGYIIQIPFKTVAEKFEVFDNNTIDVVVPYQKGKDIIKRLQKINNNPFELSSLGEVMKEAKRYTINIFKYQEEMLYKKGMLSYLFERRVAILDKYIYDNEYGLKDSVEFDVEHFMI